MEEKKRRLSNNIIPEQWGRLARLARLTCGMTQAELASKLGYTGAAVSSWELCKSVPEPWVRRSVEHFLGPKIFKNPRLRIFF